MTGRSDEDPVRWSAEGAPPGGLELLSSIERPVVLPPALRTSIRAGLPRAVAIVPAPRWITPTTLATAVVVGGIVLWLLYPAARETQRAALEITPAPDLAATGRSLGDVAPEPREDVVVAIEPLPEEPPRAPEPLSDDPSSDGDVPAPSEGSSLGVSAPAPPPGPTEPTERVVDSDVAPAPDDGTVDVGYLMANSNPWSRVFVDGRLIGTTPVLRFVLGAGRHTVRFESEAGLVSESVVTIVAGEMLRITRRLEEGAARARVDEPDDDASLYDQARAASLTGSHREVIRMLNGHCTTQRCYELLIASLRAVPGMEPDVLRNMREYLSRFPSTPRAQAYQQYLMTHGG